jgi:outer membrane cobalamin receptor
MRALHASVFAVLLLTTAFATDLKIKVVDSQAAGVPAAQISVYPDRTTDLIRVLTTSPDGTALVNNLPDGVYQLQVLAPGFAAYSASFTLPRDSSLTATLSIASVTETVVVSATRSPVPVDVTGASVSTLESAQLETMQPVATSDAIRFLPGVVVNSAGQRGSLASLFVRGGDSTYNKVLVDGVPVTEPGGTFDFGTVPLTGVDRIEVLRGAQSTLYGSDAMTSVVQLFSRSGSTETPELLFGADGGNFSTAHGYLSLAGAHDRFDYNAFLDQFNTQGQGVNNDYSNSLQGANLGARLTDRALLRFRIRHANSRTGTPNEWNFNGQAIFPPDSDERARQNNLLASLDLTLLSSAHWQHDFSGYEYNHRRLNEDTFADPGRGCDPVNFNFLDCYFRDLVHINRAGFNYQGDYAPRNWLQTTFGYEFEDENGDSNSQFLTLDLNNNPVIGTDLTHGLRLNHALFAQQRLTRDRVSLLAGFRFVHNDSFGNRIVPRVAATYLLVRGGQILSGTRLRFSYAQGIKEPTFEESFGITGTFPSDPNPNLKPEETRAFEAGFEQSFLAGRYALSAVYYNNQFRDQIEFTTNPVNLHGEYFNLNRSMAHGAELEIKGTMTRHLQLDSAYNYASTQILEAPLCTPDNFCNPVFFAGQPLLRRPKHSGSLLLNYLGTRWGGSIAGSFVGRRPDSDFLGLVPPFDHTPGYALVNVGGWYAARPRVTLYANIENLLDRHYQEVVGYPALGFNFRAGMRFRIGGD